MSRERAAELLAGVEKPRVVFVSGAGLSAASGIPTFRGPEGYWTVGSREYRPEELATYASFRRMPEEVWRWYLYRKAVCNRASPNDGHRVIAEVEKTLGDRFRLVSQNVDGLHLRAGSSLARTYQIHGNIDYMRCLSDACDDRLQPVPDLVPAIERGDALCAEDFGRLVCRSCGTATRPHVLWFDEYYNEEWFRADSTIEAAAAADVVITVGTSGATNLPHQVVAIAVRNGAILVDVNPGENPFSRLADEHPRGVWLAGEASEELPELGALLGA